MTKHISCFKTGKFTILIDLIYSPDDNGYYFEKSILPYPSGEIVYHSEKIYTSEYAALLDLKFKSVKWEKI